MRKMNKKGEWVVRDYLIALLIFSSIIALGYILLGDLATSYSNPNIVDSNFLNNYNKLNNNTALAKSMLDSTTDSSGFDIIDAGEVLLSSTFSVISLVFGSLGVIKSQLAFVASDFGIPIQITNILFTTFLSVITISLVIIIINAINKTNKL